MTELLSPSGSKESFYAAINQGADAVYLGLDLFSARRNAENFTRENLKYYIDYAHALGVKVHVAVNTLVKDKELDEFFSYVGFCNDAGVDAVIIQEMFLGRFLGKKFPDLPLHLSTQAGVNNEYGAKVAKDFGFSRVVLARETPLAEIEKITRIIETECFVQGALCTAFSGQCYMSGFAGNMSGNRGLCKQPCRKRYKIFDGQKTLDGYLISLSDLSVGKDIKRYVDAGVTSFKIEGRMRKPSFVAAATSYYRDILDGKNPSISALKRTFNRGDYTKGLAFGQDENFISDKIQSHKGESVGRIESVKKDAFKASGAHSFIAGDGGKIIRDGKEIGSFICDKSLLLRFSGEAKAGDEIYLTTDSALEKALLEKKRTLPITVQAKLLVGAPAELTARSGSNIVTVKSGSALQPAKTAPLLGADIEKCLLKTDEFPFSPSVTVKTDGVFMPKSELNELRRNIYRELFSALSFRPKRKINDTDFNITPAKNRDLGTLVLDDEFAFKTVASFSHAVLCPSDYGDNGLIDRFFKNLKGVDCDKYLYIPNKFSSLDEQSVKDIIPRFDGLFIDGYFGAELARKYGKKLIFGTGANVYNKLDLSVASSLSDGVCLSKELSVAEAKDLPGYYYSAGALKIMDLIYCPFKKSCADCKRGYLFKMTDGEREFLIRRVKLNGCRFEVYNVPLATANAKNPIVNLVTLPAEKKTAVLEAVGDKEKLKSLLKNFTTGHENKPLL